MSQSPKGTPKYANFSCPAACRPLPYKQKSKAAGWLHNASRGALALALLICLKAFGQSPELPRAQQSIGPIVHSSADAGIPTGEQETIRAHRLLALLNAERQKSMVSDANKLLRLAQEVNADLAREDSRLSPAQQAHKVAEIEKLARSVREKMSYAVSANPVIESPFSVTNP